MIGNFLSDPALDGLYGRIEGQTRASEAPQSEEVPAAATPAAPASEMLTLQGIRTGLAPVGKEEAIRAAGALLAACGYVDGEYAEAMVARERVATTYLGMGIAIPHGTAEAKSRIRRSGIVVMQYPEGVDFGEERAQLVIGIAGAGLKRRMIPVIFWKNWLFEIWYRRLLQSKLRTGCTRVPYRHWWRSSRRRDSR